MVKLARTERTVMAVGEAASTATSERELLLSVAGLVRSQVPYEAAAWLVTDPTSGLFTDGVVQQLSEETCTPWFTNEFLVDDVHKFHELVGGGAAVLSRTQDRSLSARWSEIMRPQDLDDEVRLTFDDRTGCWGIVELHRAAGSEDFTAEETRLLERLAPEIRCGLRRLAARRSAEGNAGPGGPGLLMVQPDDTVEPLTASGAAWLELLLVPEGTDVRSRTAIRTMAQIVRSAAAGGRHRADTRLRLRSADGRWVTLYAEPTLAGGGVAVVVEPSRSQDVASVLARAFELTEREQDVALAIARGDSTAEIAARLYVSAHTVRDHVKSALTKVGVNSRAELVATLFDRHYATDLYQRIAVE